MRMRNQDFYPFEPLISSHSAAYTSVTNLLNLDYFEVEPDSMTARVFDQHHITINLTEDPHRVENWRDGKRWDFTNYQNEIMITPAGMESGWRWHAKSKVIVITVEPMKLELFARRMLRLLIGDIQLKSIPQSIDKDLTQTGLMLLGALNDKPGSTVIFDNLTGVFLIKLIQRYGLKTGKNYQFSQSFTSRQYKRLMDYVALHFHESITIEDMAAAAAISSYHFSRLFKQSIGNTPYQFLMEYRIEEAKKMLSHPENTLIDVAMSCGFSDQPHFTRIFKRLTGITPRQFQQRIFS